LELPGARDQEEDDGGDGAADAHNSQCLAQAPLEMAVRESHPEERRAENERQAHEKGFGNVTHGDLLRKP
jgi:hypothetical protein